MLDIAILDIVKIFNTGSSGGHAEGRSAADGSGTRAVDHVSLRIEPGELFFLLGPSGCGKTTLLRMLAGFIEPTAGRIEFNGCDVTALPPEKRKLAMVFQNYALWPHMTVRANVEFGPRMAGLDRAARRARGEAMLATVGLAGYEQRKPTQLSGGQAQRVALARALAAEPMGLLLDEPLSNLDAALRARMRGEIRRIVKQSGATAVYVTHDQVEALSMADRMAVMHGGRIVQVGAPAEVYTRPVNRFVADFLGEANFIPARVAAADAGGVVLESPAGRLRAAALPEALGVGDACTCCVRPESLAPTDATPTTPAIPGEGLEAVCVESVLLGPTRRSVYELPGEQRVAAVSLSPAGLPTPGQRCRLNARPADVIVLAE